MTWDLRWQCVADLILPQLAVLLQLVQLWSVLGRLPLQDFGGAGNATGLATDFANATGGMMDSQGSQGDELLSYLQISQLTFTELQGFLALQCVFDGALVRLLFALLTPTGPLVVLLGCCVIEAFLRGTGIQLALKILAVLFIGGAAGALELQGCQRVDGAGEALDPEAAFPPLMPHLLCTDATWVDWIGRACAASYGVVIPSFLALLFLKQYVTMRQSKTFFATSAGSQEEVTLQLHTMSSKECMKEDVKKKRLVAAAAAYVAVHAKGRAVVNLQKDLSAVTVNIAQDAEVLGELDTGLSADFLVQPEEAAALRSRVEMLRHDAMVRMLTERSILTEIQADRSDRVMLGAQKLLCKYVSCQFVWMEVCLKLASTAMVSVVGSKDGLWLSVAITLTMALVVGMAQPFVQPQVNALQTSCFTCLALAAVGFSFRVWRWLSRLALALPVLQLLLSLLRPDSQEALALRLQQDLEKKLSVADSAEVSAKQARFL